LAFDVGEDSPMVTVVKSLLFFFDFLYLYFGSLPKKRYLFLKGFGCEGSDERRLVFHLGFDGDDVISEVELSDVAMADTFVVLKETHEVQVEDVESEGLEDLV
jgi:hypothetical protein